MRKKIIKKKSTKKTLSAKAVHIKKAVKTAQKNVIKIPVKLMESKMNESEQKVPVCSFYSFYNVRSFFIWALVAVSAITLLAAAANYIDSTEAKPKINKKLAQASVLNKIISEDENSITILATGDIMPARYVELLMRTKNDYTWPFKNVCEFLSSADITVGNLESPLLPGKNVPKDSMTFRADPSSVKGYLCAGFDLLTLANNHTMNYQVPGLTSTIKALRAANIAFAGAGKNISIAHTPSIFEVKGKKVAFYAYNDKGIPPGFHGEATANEPGIAKMDTETVKNDVKNALDKTGYGADYVIVSMHAGREYTATPTKFQQDFAHAAIDAGASVVIGHHPHQIQTIENYNNGVIFYSLGNFVFDQFFSEEVKTGIIVKIVFAADGKLSTEVFPIKIDKTQPRILEGGEKAQVLAKLGIVQ